MIGLLIDPATGTHLEIEFDQRDWRAVQRLIGGTFDHCVLRDGAGDPLALVYFGIDLGPLDPTAAFAFPASAVFKRDTLRWNWPFVGRGLLVGFNGMQTSDYSPELHAIVGTISHFETAAVARASKEYFWSTARGCPEYEDQLSKWQNSEMWAAFSQSHDPIGEVIGYSGSLFTDPAVREAREFVPRPVGSFSSARCSVAELESAFLGLHEWVRKDRDHGHDSPLGRSLGAVPFFFPCGLEPTEEEFNAGVSVADGSLALPFPLRAFWIVRWDTWLGDGALREGPAMLHVEAEAGGGFSALDIFFDRKLGYHISGSERFQRLGQTPNALLVALFRLNNRRYIIERDVRTAGLEQVNAGRARSKHGLAPLPGFIRVTGRVAVDRPPSSGMSGIERCRHDRRAHWRKRRNGVELPAHEWVHIRQTTIHPERPARVPNPYVVV